jgi:hypothetical protein
MPACGVGNSITRNPVGLSGIVKRSAMSLALSPRISSAAVIKTSSASGLPRVPDARVIALSGTTLATASGTRLLIPSIALGQTLLTPAKYFAALSWETPRVAPISIPYKAN